MEERRKDAEESEGEKENRQKEMEKEKSIPHRLLLQLEGYSIQMFIRGFYPQQFIGMEEKV